MVAVLVALAVTSCKKPPAGSSVPAPIPTVMVATVVQKDVPIYEEAVGTTVGFVNADILPKVSGYLLKQDYQDGSRVHAGQLLFEIDPRPYQAALNQALGNLAQARAQLKQNQQDLARYTKLYNQAVIPAQKFDNVTQTTQASAAGRSKRMKRRLKTRSSTWGGAKCIRRSKASPESRRRRSATW
jgi:multidrug efflux pump subunit AcrA (membrane-fusion protein)